jgi:hypothetical protein
MPKLVAMCELLCVNCVENILVDALCFLKVLSDERLNRATVTRAHAPRHGRTGIQRARRRLGPSSSRLGSSKYVRSF